MDARTNQRIRVPQVRVIDAEGKQLGIMPTHLALTRALDSGFDLVEVDARSRPPVCKIMDYGKAKYEAKKKASENRPPAVKLKEIKLRPRTEEHDYETKLRQVRAFLEEGHKVKVVTVFQGREMAHREIGQKQLQDMAASLKDIGVVEQAPRLEGKAMFMLLRASSG